MISGNNSDYDKNVDNRIFTHIVSQTSLTVKGKDCYRKAQEKIMKWAFESERGLKNIPDAAWAGETFEIDSDDSEFAGAVKIDDPVYWAFRLNERLKDPQMPWITDVGIAKKENNEVILGCRLTIAQRGKPEFIPRSVPKFIRGICFTMDTWLDGRKTSPDPWLVQTQDDVIDLTAFLMSSDRKAPLVLFSLPEGSNDIEKTAIPVKSFIRRTAGYVHSAVITSEASYVLTNELSKTFSTFGQAVRTYNPGFDIDTSSPYQHPLATMQRIQNWQSSNNPETFDAFLVRCVLKPLHSRQKLEKQQYSYQQVKQINASLLRKKSGKNAIDADQLLEIADDEIKAAKTELNEYKELLETAEEERKDAEEECAQWKSRFQIVQKRLEVQQDKYANNIPEPDIPETLDDFEDWARNNLSGQVEVHRRAIKALCSSHFQDVELVYKALLLLRDYYVPMRRKGGSELKNAYDKKCAELKLEDQQCFNQPGKAKQFGGEYFVWYDGRECELDRHLKGSSSRKQQYAFRLYFFWDEVTRQVVVGYLPGHLSTDKT